MRQQVAIGLNRFFGVVDDEQFLPWLKPLLDAQVRVGDNAAAHRCQLKRPRGGGSIDRCVRLAGDAQVDFTTVGVFPQLAEGGVEKRFRIPDQAVHARCPNSEPNVGHGFAGLTDHCVDPVRAKLGAVPVKEDVDVLLRLNGCKEIRISSVVERVNVGGTQRFQLGNAPLGVGEEAIILAQVRALVDSERESEALESGETAGHIAIIEEEGNGVLTLDAPRQSDKMVGGHAERQHRGHVAFVSENPVEVALPLRSDPDSRGDANELLEWGFLRFPPEFLPDGAPRLTGESLDPPENVTFQPTRVVVTPPPGRLNRGSLIGRGNDFRPDLA